MDRSAREKLSLTLRGALALVVALGVGVVMVLRGSGTFDRTEDIYVEVPAAVGLVNGGAPVRYHGVDIGRISGIDAGKTESRLRLAVESSATGKVPGSVLARVVPRTFFGDVYIELVDPTDAVTTAAGTTLKDVDTITVDTGPEAVAMYDVFTRMADVLEEMKPEQMTVALSALGTALDGNGETIGRTIDRLAAVSADLAPALSEFIDATPQFVEVMDSLATATPDMVEMMASAAEVSRAIVDNEGQLADAFDAAILLAASVDGFTGSRQDSMITVTNSFGTILATTAANPQGLHATLQNAGSFGAAGARVFGSGRFDITAVPTFEGPLPYTAADCPTYGNLTGDYCNSPGNGSYAAPTRPVVNAAQEAGPLSVLEDHLSGIGIPLPGSTPASDKSGDSSDSSVVPSLGTAAATILAPLVRGNEVQIP